MRGEEETTHIHTQKKKELKRKERKKKYMKGRREKRVQKRGLGERERRKGRENDVRDQL